MGYVNMLSIVVQISGLVLIASAAYLNKYDQPLDFKCPEATQTISRVHSVHDNFRNDRKFDISCTDIPLDVDAVNASCNWTDYANAFDELLHFSCPNNHYINGMHSYHDNHVEDRRWKFYCCQLSDVHLSDCILSGWTNNYDKVQDYQLPDNTVMKGVISVHDNRHEDRIYEYEYCGVYYMDDNVIVG